MTTLTDRRVWSANPDRWVADAVSGQDYDPFGMVRPNRSVSEDGYRFGFNGKEKDTELSNESYDFGARIYDGRVGRWLSVDRKSDELPGITPYAHALDNPLVYKDGDGNLPILPLLLKAGAAGGADMMLQAAMAYLFDPKVETVGQAFEKVDKWIVGKSFLEGLVPWKTPGGRLGKAALTATTDVIFNAGMAFKDGEEYSQEQAMQDFLVGFLGDLAGEGMGELFNKYGAKNVANGLKKVGLMLTRSKGLLE